MATPTEEEPVTKTDEREVTGHTEEVPAMPRVIRRRGLVRIATPQKEDSAPTSGHGKTQPTSSGGNIQIMAEARQHERRRTQARLTNLRFAMERFMDRFLDNDRAYNKRLDHLESRMDHNEERLERIKRHLLWILAIPHNNPPPPSRP